MFVEGYNTGLTRYSEIHGTIDVLLCWHDHPVNEAVSRRHVIPANFLAAQLIKEWSCCPLSLTILIKTVRCHWPLRWRASLVWFASPVIIPDATRKGDRTRLLLLRKLFHLLAEKYGLRTDRGAGGGILAGDPLDLPVPIPIRCWHRPVDSRRAPETWPSILIIVWSWSNIWNVRICCCWPLPWPPERGWWAGAMIWSVLVLHVCVRLRLRLRPLPLVSADGSQSRGREAGPRWQTGTQTPSGHYIMVVNMRKCSHLAWQQSWGHFFTNSKQEPFNL